MARTRLIGEAHQQKAVIDENGELLTIPAAEVIESLGFGFSLMDTGLVQDTKSVISQGRQSRLDSTSNHCRFDCGPYKNHAGYVRDNIFTAGWAKRGATGTIASNVADGAETAASLLAYLQKIDASTKVASLGLDEVIRQAGTATSFDDWGKLAKTEIENGRGLGKAVQKIVSLQEMLDTLKTKA